MHARKAGESSDAEALRAKLQPGGATARRLEDTKVQSELTDAKRKGSVISGTAVAETGGRAGAEYTRSSKFFANLQGGKAGQGSGKRAAGDADGAPPAKAMRFKL